MTAQDLIDTVEQYIKDNPNLEIFIVSNDRLTGLGACAHNARSIRHLWTMIQKAITSYDGMSVTVLDSISPDNKHLN